MTFNDLPISETITGLLTGLVGWFTGGKLNAKSKEISNTAELIAFEVWPASPTHHIGGREVQHQIDRANALGL